MSLSRALSGKERNSGRPVRRHGFGRDSRLRLSRDFQDAFSGQTRHVGRFMVIWLREAPESCGRAGVIASRRTFRRAVDRNRAKRLLREAFRLNKHRLTGRYDYVFVARRRLVDAVCSDVERDLLRLAGRGGMQAGQQVDGEST